QPPASCRPVVGRRGRCARDPARRTSRLNSKSWGPAELADSVCKDHDERFLEQLKRWIDILLDGTFSPAEAMVRSAMEALSVMFMYLIPVYATLQFSAARNYSVNVTWSGILGRC